MRILGCIADDVTGATDIGSVLASVGRDVLVVFDTERTSHDDLAGVDAIVVALKSRTAPVARAVADSVAAAHWAADRGAERMYVKYCSTFDSTPAGNIGPVIDAIMAEFDYPVALVAPSYPQNGRTVYHGHLFVHDKLLDESSMRDHPLTPMRDSNLQRLLAPQTTHDISSLSLAEVRGGGIPDALAADAEPRIVIADAIEDADLVALAEGAHDGVLLTGGAGLALGLGADGERGAWHPVSGGSGGRLVLSGSASSTTRAQIARARQDLPALKLDPDALTRGPGALAEYADEVFAWVARHWDEEPSLPVLVYATDSLDDLAERDDPAAAAEAVETVLASVARRAAADGLSALIVAGGETSGRIVQELGIPALRVGPVIAPGVVWATAATTSGPIALALKSGNFGAEDMFVSAWKDLT